MAAATNQTNWRRLSRFSFVKLEFILFAAACSLLLQLFPADGRAVVEALDFRHWSARTWRLVSLSVFAAFGMLCWRTTGSRSSVHRALIAATILFLLIFVCSIIGFFVPGVWQSLLQLINPSNWSSLGWVGLFVAILIAIFLCRHAPEWRASWVAHSNEVAKKKKRERESERKREEKKRVSDIIIRGGRIDF
jgi:hypothetical protein